MEKICGFYVSDIHLITMILPYLKKQLSENVMIETFFENSLKDNLSSILNSLIINSENKKEILNINWESNKIKKYSNFEKNIKNILKTQNQIIFLIKGSKKYISQINELFNKFIQRNNNNIKIINCFEISKFDDDIKEILDNHEFILNTSGIHKIEEVFEEYKKEKVN